MEYYVPVIFNCYVTTLVTQILQISVLRDRNQNILTSNWNFRLNSTPTCDRNMTNMKP